MPKMPKMRVLFPPLQLTELEDQQLEVLAASLVQEYLRDWQRYQLASASGRAPPQLQLIQKHKKLQVFEHRPTSFAFPPRTVRSNSASQALEPSSTSTRLVAVGSLHSDLDDVLYASMATSTEAMHLQMAIVDDHAMDGRVLHTIKSPTQVDPFRFTGIKWMLRRPGSTVDKFVRKRDFVVLEAIGITAGRSGERIGYHLTHSVEFSTTPPLRRHAIIRGKMSSCRFYSQTLPSTVDVWACGALDLQGEMWHRVALNEGAALMRTMCDLPLVAQSKKLMWHLQNQEPASHPDFAVLHDAKPAKHKQCCACSEPFHWLWKRGQTCQVCSGTMCTRCTQAQIVMAHETESTTIGSILCCARCIVTVRETSTPFVASDDAEISRNTMPGRDSHAPLILRKRSRRTRTSSTESTYSSVSITNSTCSVPSIPTDSLGPCHRERSCTQETSEARMVSSSPPLSNAPRAAGLFTTLTALQAVADATFDTQRHRGEQLRRLQHVDSRSARRATAPQGHY